MTRFTAITTCKGRLEHIRQTLPALCAQADCEVVVVDYDCPDGVGAWVRSAQPDAWVVRASDRPLFNISEARNLGAAAASGEWLIFLDADVLVSPTLTEQIAPLLSPGVFLLPDPRTDELWGALVVSRADFEAVGGYDEAFEGWGSEDLDMTTRLWLAGRSVAAFPGELLTSLPHGEDERTRFHAIGDRGLNVGVNSLYRAIKTDLLKLGAELDLAARRRLYDDVRRAITAPGGPTTLRVGFRQTEHGGRSVSTSLTYELKAAAPPTTPD
jgi:hypothetical protein